MEAVSRPFNGKNYWRKNGYTLLDGATTKRKIQVVKINGDSGGGGEGTGAKRKRFWRLRRAPKVVMVAMRPKRLWDKLRDGYVSMMMKVAGDVGRLNGGSDFLGRRIPGPARKGRVPSKQRLEDFESRLVLEIYKAMATSRGISEV